MERALEFCSPLFVNLLHGCGSMTLLLVFGNINCLESVNDENMLKGYADKDV